MSNESVSEPLRGSEASWVASRRIEMRWDEARYQNTGRTIRYKVIKPDSRASDRSFATWTTTRDACHQARRKPQWWSRDKHHYLSKSSPSVCGYCRTGRERFPYCCWLSMTDPLALGCSAVRWLCSNRWDALIGGLLPILHWCLWTALREMQNKYNCMSRVDAFTLEIFMLLDRCRF